MTNAVHHPERKATAVGSGSSTPDTGSGTAFPAAFDARMVVFQQLKPHTSQLLLHRDSPARLQASLQRLKTVIQDADADGLNSPGCMDYALFPLMFGVDSIAATRQAGQALQSSAINPRKPCIQNTITHICSTSPGQQPGILLDFSLN